MNLKRLTMRHWRHQWEFVENPATGSWSRRCVNCGAHKVFHGSAARRAGVEQGERFHFPG